jgi:hypothetical protein
MEISFCAGGPSLEGLEDHLDLILAYSDRSHQEPGVSFPSDSLYGDMVGIAVQDIARSGGRLSPLSISGTVHLTHGRYFRYII